MTETFNLYYLARMLRLTAMFNIREYLSWRVDDLLEPYVRFYVDGVEIFDWEPTLTEEPVNPSDVDAFAAAVEAVAEATEGDATYGPLLYVARKRGVRPINSLYPSDSRLWPLFDAAGPDTEGGQPESRSLRLVGP